MTTPTPSYVTFPPGTPVRLRIRQWRVEPRELKDPSTGQVKTIDVLVLEVTHVNDEERSTQATFTAFKAIQTITPLLTSGLALRRPVEIVRRGSGYLTEYEVRVL